jgi:hypothetical protein
MLSEILTSPVERSGAESGDLFNTSTDRSRTASSPACALLPRSPLRSHTTARNECGAGFDVRVEREFFIDNLLVRIHRCFWWTGLAPWEFEFPFPGSLISTFLDDQLVNRHKT